MAVREIRCAKLPFDVSQTAVYVSDEHCRLLSDVRPSETVECVGSCLSTHWIYSTWSEVWTVLDSLCAGICALIVLSYTHNFLSFESGKHLIDNMIEFGVWSELFLIGIDGGYSPLG